MLKWFGNVNVFSWYWEHLLERCSPSEVIRGRRSPARSTTLLHSVVYVLGTWLSCAKTAELIKMLCGGQTPAGPRNLVLYGFQIWDPPPVEKALLRRDFCELIARYWDSAKVDVWWWCSPCQITLDACLSWLSVWMNIHNVYSCAK